MLYNLRGICMDFKNQNAEYELARNFMECGNFEEASLQYTILSRKYSDDWEAKFYSEYCARKLGKTPVSEASQQGKAFRNVIPEIFRLVKEIDSVDERNLAIETIATKTITLTEEILDRFEEYRGLLNSVVNNVLFRRNTFHNLVYVIDAFVLLGDEIFAVPDVKKENLEIGCLSWEMAIKSLKRVCSVLSKYENEMVDKMIVALEARIINYRKDYKPAQESNYKKIEELIAKTAEKLKTAISEEEYEEAYADLKRYSDSEESIELLKQMTEAKQRFPEILKEGFKYGSVDEIVLSYNVIMIKNKKIMYDKIKHIKYKKSLGAMELEVESNIGFCSLMADKEDFERLKSVFDELAKRLAQLNPEGLTEKEPNFIVVNKNETAKSEGCYVATCVYGSYDCPQVWTLRRYRDNTLGSTWYGRAFIRTYYTISPTLVRLFGNKKSFKRFWKNRLDKMISKLNSQGVENTPYNDKNWR